MSQTDPPPLAAFLEADKAGWDEVEDLVNSLSPEQAQRPGFLPGWSVKDFMAHLAGWLSEASLALEQIKAGSFTGGDDDVDARNATFVEANRDQPLPIVLFEATMTHRRLLHHLHGLTAIPAAAATALHKGGPDHYAEHLPGLREWVGELRSGPGAAN